MSEIENKLRTFIKESKLGKMKGFVIIRLGKCYTRVGFQFSDVNSTCGGDILQIQVSIETEKRAGRERRLWTEITVHTFGPFCEKCGLKYEELYFTPLKRARKPSGKGEPVEVVSRGSSAPRTSLPRARTGFFRAKKAGKT